MKNNHSLSHFTNKYPVSKTLRFELIPQGRTLEHIQAKGLLEEDEHRAESYKKVKRIIDEYHKKFIDKALTGLKLEGLAEFQTFYWKNEKDDNDKKAFENLKADLRKQIAYRFSKNDDETIQYIYNNLFAKELIKEDIIRTVSGEEKALINEFENFTTYFTGFHENRKNIYKHEEKATAVAYRLIHENLPKFLDNLKIYETIKQKHSQLDFSLVEIELEDVIQGTPINEIFSLDFFNETLTQRGIELYNILLGGKSEEGQKKTKGLNEYINLYRQQNNIKLRELPNFKPLYKQILSDRESISFLPESFETDMEVLDSIRSFYEVEIQKSVKDGKEINVLNEVSKLMRHLKDFDTSKIFIKNDLSLTNISQKLFGDWSVISNALNSYYETENPIAGHKGTKKKYDEKKEKWIAKTKFFSIAEIEKALEIYKNVNENVNENWKPNPVLNYFAGVGIEKDENTQESKSLIQNLEAEYINIKELLHIEYDTKRNLAQDKTEVVKIKSFLDSIIALLRFVKPLHSKEIEQEKDEAFYSAYIKLFDQINQVTPLYNKVRNYLTRKPYSTEKLKLNFENSTLLDGWDQNKEVQNTSVLFRKNGLFYLGIMNKNHNKLFNDIQNIEPDTAVYQKMVYKLLPGANKMLPKVFFSKKNIDYFNPSSAILNNYKSETHKKGINFNLNDCHALIDFFKTSINKHEDWKHFNFKFSETSSYDDLSGFYREVEQQGYKVTFQDVPEAYINKLVDEGKLYLFQLYNKDFSPYSKGKPNLHTLYWKMLFEKENLQNVFYKLNGQAEVFYRKKSLHYDDKTLKTGHHADKLKNKFDYPIISNRRFAFDKFQFHVPITMNFKSKGLNNVNWEVLEYLKDNPDVNIIGIDRGERHLLYVTIIDQQGNIKEKGQFSFNEIISQYKNKEGSFKNKVTSYHEKLNEKEKGRDEARKSWGLIENIKELKEGYLSQVVQQLSKIIVDYNAIVVMEDLNAGFKRGRQKVEKQVYQKFEKMLIDKLNYLVFKDEQSNMPGGVLNAYQLSNKFESFKKMGKQNGFIFYVPAALTSKIDPVTGFVNFLYPKYESEEKTKIWINKFDRIVFNALKNRFEFRFDYNNFTTKAEGTKTKWTLCLTEDIRYIRNSSLNNNKGGQEEFNAKLKLETLLVAANIDYTDGKDFKEKILLVNNAQFFKELTKILAVTLSLRHNNGLHGNEERDFILSPVENENGEFFNSLQSDETLPRNADANGAFNIALKGLWVLQQINKAEDWRKLKLAISNKEWLQFVQQKPFMSNKGKAANIALEAKERLKSSLTS